METEIHKFRVEVGLYSHCMEGRSGYRSSIRPNHWIPGKDYTFAGQLDFEGQDLLAPGETCNAMLSAMLLPEDIALFKPGFAWHICEANKIMGYAKVV